MKTENKKTILGWFPMSKAPQDGTLFLALLETDCGSIQFLDIISYSLGDTVWETNHGDEVYATPLCWSNLPDTPNVDLLLWFEGESK